MENVITTVNGIRLSPETLKYLAEIQEDLPYFIDELIRLNDIFISNAVLWGETRESEDADTSQEMNALHSLKYFRDFLETMREKR